mmetsp:Transcript_542/g.1548  ORF Transcript_542/g.1548 Transcript_542/m.1548 type:complete len:271 (-) Transcript_542:68-880(-)
MMLMAASCQPQGVRIGRSGQPPSRRGGSRLLQCHNKHGQQRRQQLPDVGRRSWQVCASQESSSVLDNMDDLALVKKVALSGSKFQMISAREMFESLVKLNQIKTKKPDDLSEILAGDDGEGKGSFWKLVFTVSKSNLNQATSKGLGSVSGNGGSFFPVTAVQNWNNANMRIQNGIFILGVFSLIFSGDFELVNKSGILYFDFDRLDIALGPIKFGFDLPPDEKRAGKKRPFFVWVHADQDIAIARGRGGGLAVWKRVDQEYREEEGVYSS